MLESLPIRIEPASTASVWHDTLASRDLALQAAARNEGVPLLPP
ncbi:MAG: hypothetical protein VKO00_04650 [Cyanobacteriota bacterium]|nr:hypothetical protein [Cyanobacteriota bacterium]